MIEKRALSSGHKPYPTLLDENEGFGQGHPKFGQPYRDQNHFLVQEKDFLFILFLTAKNADRDSPACSS